MLFAFLVRRQLTANCQIPARLPPPCSFARIYRLRIRWSSTSTSSEMGAVGTQTVDTSARLKALRELMSQTHNVDAFVVPSEDQRMLSLGDCKL